MVPAAAIETEDLEVSGDANLWEVMRAGTRAKEAHPSGSLLPTMRVLRSNEVVAIVYQSSEEPRTLLVRNRAGLLHRVSAKWCDLLVMLYRITLLTLQQMEGSSVVFLGEREGSGRAMICAMKWTARQFSEQPPRDSLFPETRDSISKLFCLDDSKICWLSEVTAALQFSTN